MNTTIDFARIADIFRHASEEGRDFLFEYEVYELLARSGAETPPRTLLLRRGGMPSDEELTLLPGEKAVLKIVSPAIVHKTEVGGVRIVPKTPEKIRSAVRRMFYEVPENFTALVERHPEYAPAAYAGLTGQDLLDAASRDIKGVLLVQFMPPDSGAFGNELIVGLRRTREFGTVISAGLGGTDTELYAERFRKGQAIVAASTQMLDGEDFFDLFRGTISYRKLAGLTRGQRRIVTDEQLVECFDSFIRMARHFGPDNADAPFVIDELEINPFAFTDFLMVPLDGLCRFSLPKAAPLPRPSHKIGKLLHPESIGIVGVSATRRNFGRVIMDNVLGAGFPKEKLTLLRPGDPHLEGIRCIPRVEELPAPLDMLVVAVGAEHVPDLVDSVIDHKAAHSVMLIAGGMGETSDSHERAARVVGRIAAAHGADDGGPVFLGANCMGVVSRPGSYDTWFIPEAKLPKAPDAPYHRAALISQSGAFMLHRISQKLELSPAYMISMGNQSDLTLGDMVEYFSNDGNVDVIAVYAEGFNDGDGLHFVRSVRAAVEKGKEVIFYKAGRTPEGKNATSGHTASLAGDYMVCESCVRQAGAIVARTFTEFQNLILLAEHLHHKTVQGRRLGAVSGAGFEAVGMADSIQSDEYSMTLGAFGPHTRHQLQELLAAHKLDALVTVQNPLDINPAANDDVHAQAAQLLLDDQGIDAVVLGLDPLSPVTHSLDTEDGAPFSLHHAEGMVARLREVAAKSTKPLVGVVDGGALFEAYRQAVMAAGIPVFRVCDEAIAALSLYMESRLAARKRF